MSYRDEVKALAESLGSDGCTLVLQVHQVCCWEHDIAYRTGHTPRRVPITKAQADRRFRDCNQAHSPFRFLSPMAGWRWLAVSWFGRAVVKPAPPGLLLSLDNLDALAAARAARERMAVEDSTNPRRVP